MKVLITGGCGFIGSALIRYLIRETEAAVVNVDKLTYAAAPDALDKVEGETRYAFEKADICDGPALRSVFARHRPDAVMHLAAESHVDRSIDSPAAFIQTNVVGTFTLLQTALAYWGELEPLPRRAFRFLHVSTDEVYGSLGTEGRFSESTPYRPNSPYSASKAASDHLARVWHRTFGLPVITSNCSNNYGPFQFPEKLIPLMIINGLRGQALPVYGTGKNVRDWLYVDDHVRALWTVLIRGRIGETYNIGGDSEVQNIDLVRAICGMLDEIAPRTHAGRREELIEFVPDRPGHDLRYAIDASKIKRELGWSARETFESGLRKTIDWYLDNRTWWERILESRYDGTRLGLGGSTHVPAAPAEVARGA